MCSMHNEGKSVAVERFIRILKKKIIHVWLQFQNMFILINQIISFINAIIHIIA